MQSFVCCVQFLFITLNNIIYVINLRDIIRLNKNSVVTGALRRQNANVRQCMKETTRRPLTKRYEFIRFCRKPTNEKLKIQYVERYTYFLRRLTRIATADNFIII